jgi:methylmalonyl-CoA mutase cobalamin-binding subunit
MGGRRIEAAFGAGQPEARAMGGRVPVVPATILSEIAEMSRAALAEADPGLRPGVKGLRVLVATSDVHEHGKLLIDEMLRQLGVEALDGGTSTDPGPLAARAADLRPDAIALSTYNGVALAYFLALKAELAAHGLDQPILIGGRLNQIPEGSNSSLPVDVGAELTAAGALVCRAASELLPALAMLRRGAQAKA